MPGNSVRLALLPLASVLAAAAGLWLVAIGAPAAAQPLAERIAQCAGCHGEDGNSRLERVPSLAGQPAFFVLNQLILMREGVRPVEAMTPFVKGLTDADAEALAQHYAKLPPKRSDEPVDPALAARGAALAKERVCGTCHLAGLEGEQQIPRIAKQRIDYLIQSLKEFRDGTRAGADTNMSVPLAGLSDADLVALAHYAAGR
jgi:cytochrome c553